MPRSGALKQVSGLQVKTVATLGIHPFMLSKWRKDVREGTIRGRLPESRAHLARAAVLSTLPGDTTLALRAQKRYIQPRNSMADRSDAPAAGQALCE